MKEEVVKDESVLKVSALGRVMQVSVVAPGDQCVGTFGVWQPPQEDGHAVSRLVLVTSLMESVGQDEWRRIAKVIEKFGVWVEIEGAKPQAFFVEHCDRLTQGLFCESLTRASKLPRLPMLDVDELPSLVAASKGAFKKNLQAIAEALNPEGGQHAFDVGDVTIVAQKTNGHERLQVKRGKGLAEELAAFLSGVAVEGKTAAEIKSEMELRGIKPASTGGNYRRYDPADILAFLANDPASGAPAVAVPPQDSAPEVFTHQSPQAPKAKPSRPSRRRRKRKADPKGRITVLDRAIELGYNPTPEQIVAVGNSLRIRYRQRFKVRPQRNEAGFEVYEKRAHELLNSSIVVVLGKKS